jgi:hypothetical protein
VKDISEGGVGLLLPRRFEPGTLLIVQLDPSTAPHAVYMLARVVRIAAQGDGNWLAGCTFIGELSGQELQSFRQEWLRSPQKDRRASVRIPPKIRAVCRYDTAVATEEFTAEIRDLSLGGVGLVTTRKLELGMLLKIMLPASHAEQTRALPTRVVRIDRLPSGRWLAGCEICQDSAETGPAAPHTTAQRRVGGIVRQRPGGSAQPKRPAPKTLTDSLPAVEFPPPLKQTENRQSRELAVHVPDVETQVYQAFAQLADQFLAKLRSELRPQVGSNAVPE